MSNARSALLGSGAMPLQGMVMVSPEMNPTICSVFEAEIVLLFHATTFRRGFQVTVHVGNVRQTAVVEKIHAKVRVQPCFLSAGKSARRLRTGGALTSYLAESGLIPSREQSPWGGGSSPPGGSRVEPRLTEKGMRGTGQGCDHFSPEGQAADRGEGSGTFPFPETPRVPEGGRQTAVPRGCYQGHRPCHRRASHHSGRSPGQHGLLSPQNSSTAVPTIHKVTSGHAAHRWRLCVFLG